MIKGEIPYDAAKAKEAADTMVAKSASIDIAMLFPKGSETGGETTASPKIWDDAAGFKAAMEKMKSTVAAEAPNTAMGLDKLKLAAAAMGKTCKACHDDYRIQKP
jgi:cytochrome c556